MVQYKCVYRYTPNMYVCMYVEVFMENKKFANVFLLDKKSVNT